MKLGSKWQNKKTYQNISGCVTVEGSVHVCGSDNECNLIGHFKSSLKRIKTVR